MCLGNPCFMLELAGSLMERFRRPSRRPTSGRNTRLAPHLVPRRPSPMVTATESKRGTSTVSIRRASMVLALALSVVVAVCGQEEAALTPSPVPMEATGVPRMETLTSAVPAGIVPPGSASLGDTCTRPADDMTMVYVPGGEFIMGTRWSLDADSHTVSLDAF